MANHAHAAGESAAQAATGTGARRTLIASCAAHFVHDGIADAFYVLLPVWARAFALDYAQIGTLRMAYASAMALLQMPAGVLAERLGHRVLLAAGSLLAACAFGLLATAEGYRSLFLLILLTGAGCATQHPIASSLIASAVVPTARRAALGVYNFAGDVGKMLVAAAMGLAIAAIGWQSSIAAYAVVVAVVAIAVFLLLGSTPRPRARAVEVGPRARKGNARAFALLATIHVIDSACRTGFLTFVPFLLIAKGASVASIGLALAVIFVGGAAGKLVCGLVAERVGIVRTVVLTELATGLAIGLTLVAPLFAMLAILIPLGVALNGTSSVLYGTVAEFVAEDRQSRSFGLFYALGSAAGASAPPLLGVVGDLLGLTQALLLVALLALVTVPLALGLHPHLTLAERPRAPV